MSAAAEAAGTGMVGRARARLAYPGWRMVGVLAVTETVSWGILYYAFAVFLVPMQADLGASRGALSGAYAVAIVTSGVAAPLVGRWVDRHGARGLMAGGSAAAAGLVWAWSTVEGLTGLYLVWAAIGLVSAAVLYEPAFAVVTAWFSRDRARAVLAITVVAGFASTIFLPAGTALIAAHGWRGAARWLAVILAVTTVAPLAIVLRRRPADHGLRPDGSGPAVDPVADRPHGASAGQALRDRPFRWLALTFTLGTVSVVAVSAHLPALLVDRGESAAFAAVATGGLGALSVTGRILLTIAERRVEFPRLLAAVFVAQAVALASLPVVSGRAAVVGFVVLYGIGFGAITIARPLILAHLYGTRAYGTIAGVLAGVTTLARAAAPVAAGLTYDLTGSYTPILLILAVLTAVAAGGLVPVLRAWRAAEAAGRALGDDRVPAGEAPDTSTGAAVMAAPVAMRGPVSR